MFSEWFKKNVKRVLDEAALIEDEEERDHYANAEALYLYYGPEGTIRREKELKSRRNEDG